jgi:hypothetical protein
MAMTLDLYIDQGSDFSAVLPAVTTASGSVQDLTNHTVVSQMKRSYLTSSAVPLTATVTDASDGIITLSLASTDTIALAPYRYVYDVVITDQSSVSTKVFEGIMTVNPGVSTVTNPVFTTPYIPKDFGGL